MPITLDQAQEQYDNQLPDDNECEDCQHKDEDVICGDCGEHAECCSSCGTDCCGAKPWNEREYEVNDER